MSHDAGGFAWLLPQRYTSGYRRTPLRPVPEPGDRSGPKEDAAMDRRPPAGSTDVPTGGRLDSWKEIAAYLQRDVRTARRWEAEGLPVHRHQHQEHATVYAYREEVDAWVRSPQRAANRNAGASGRAWRWGLAAAAILIAVFVTIAVRPTAPPSLDFNERDWVLVTAFENQTGDSVLDGTLRAALTRELSESRFMNVVPPERVGDVLRLMQQPTDARVDRARGLEVALRDGGIRAVLTGQVERFDATYVLSAAILDPTTGTTVTSVTREADGQENILPAIRQLSGAVREALGEALPSIAATDQRLVRVTTPSLRALQLYSQADAVIAGRGGPNGNAVAEELLRETVALDPDFASAYIHLAWAIRNQGRTPEDYRPPAQRAFALIDTTSDRERYFILGSYHAMFDRDEDAITTYETLLRLYPAHYWGTNNLAYMYRRAGRREEASALRLRLVDLRPQDLRRLLSSVRLALRTGDLNLDAVMPYVERAQRLAAAEMPRGSVLPSQSAWLAYFSVYERLLTGHAEQALALVNRFADDIPALPGDGREIWIREASAAYLALGALEAAETMAQRLSAESERRRYLAYVAWARGDLASVRAHGQYVPPLVRVLEWPLAGESRWVSEFVDDPTSVQVAPALEEALTHIARGHIALSEDDAVTAIRELEAGLRASKGNAAFYFLGSAALADAWERFGDAERAVRVLESAAQLRDQFFLGGATFKTPYLRTQAERARLARALGHHDDATRIEAELLAMLAMADDDHQILREIRERQAARQPEADLRVPSAD